MRPLLPFIIFFQCVSAATVTEVVATEIVTVTSSVPTPTSSEYSDDDDFKNAVLNSTNTYRSQHNATALKWNDTLASYAQKWSDGCEFKHSGGAPGENLASGYPNTTSGVEAWGNERSSYDFSKAQFSEQTGHFTQLVWKSTTTVGCSRTNCADKQGDDAAPGWYVVCEYWPAGNIIGQFKQNVQSEGTGKSGSGDCPQGAVCSGATPRMPEISLASLALLPVGVVVVWWFL